jgi:tetratricopeptide (TPR) repeat protein
MKRRIAMVFFLMLVCARMSAAQQVAPYDPPPPPPEPVFDPFHAAKSIEVGNFYMKKGKYDAAIDRYRDATEYQPGLAMPWKLLGEAYEKKHENARAVEAYKKYLEILPRAEDAAKVKSRIAALAPQSGQSAGRQAAKQRSQ